MWNILRFAKWSLEGSDFNEVQVYNYVKTLTDMLSRTNGFIVGIGKINHPIKNRFGEPFRWYDDLVHYAFSNTHIAYPSEKTKQDLAARGLDWKKMDDAMSKTWYSSGTAYKSIYRQLPDGTKDYGNYD